MMAKASHARRGRLAGLLAALCIFRAFSHDAAAAVSAATAAGGGDPCVEHETIAGVLERNMEAELLPFDKPLCDAALGSTSSTTWYRVVHDEDSGRLGEDMPTWPPGINRCGTVYPIWLNGTLPHTYGEVVSRIACTDGGNAKPALNSRCFEQRTVKIKHCGDYNVYWLPRVSSCPQSYCFGEVPCPPGWTSRTGFEPACKVADFIDQPAVSWELSSSHPKQLRFLCDLPPRQYEKGLLLNVTWSYSYKTVAGGRVHGVLGAANKVSLEDLPVALSEDGLPSGFRFDAEISCSMTPWSKDGVIGANKSSKPFFIGIEASPRQITLLEGERQVIQLTATVPFTCRTTNASVSDGCALYIDVGISPSCTSAARGPPSNNLLVDGSNCGASISGWPDDGSRNGTATTAVVVLATADGRFGWPQETVQKRVTFKTVAGLGVALGWDGLQLPEIDVKIVDRDRTSPTGMCYSNNDPHMQTFDKRQYEMHLQGAFILYRNSMMNVEVQSFYQPCSPGSSVTCNCALAVRSGADVFILDACDKIRVSTGTRGRFFRVGLVGCANRGLVTVASSGSAYEILLPTGASVRVAYNQNGPYSVTVIPGSKFDVRKTSGLCGVFSGSPEDDFMLPNGLTLTDYTFDFANGWRVSVNDSLFVRLPYFGGNSNTKVSVTDSSKVSETSLYCNCDATRPEAQFPPRGLSQNACVRVQAIAGRDCSAFSQKSHGTCNVKETAVIGDLLFESFVYIYDDGKKDDQKSDWRNGWTEQKANAHCKDYLLNSSILKPCLTISSVDLDKAIRQCVLDIKLMGTTEYQFVAAELIATECKAAVERNVTMWDPVPGSDGLELPTWAVAVTCPANCSNQGACVKGSCKCNEPYYGSDCSNDGRQPPTLTELSSHCDQSLSRNACGTAVRLYGDNFSLSEQGLVCKFDLVKVRPDDAPMPGASEQSRGIANSFGQADCSIPTGIKQAIFDKRLPMLYNVSVSNDGKTYSNKLGVWIYDSNCHICHDVRTSCSLRPDVCLIDGTCYAANTTRPGKSEQTCVPAQSTSEWTTPEELKIPKLTQTPVLLWRLVKESAQPQLAFVCDFNRTEEKLLAFDVAWISEITSQGKTLEKQLIVVRNVSQEYFPVLLRPADIGEDFKLGIKMFCEITPYYWTSKLKGNPLRSTSLFAGIEVKPASITITEGQAAKITLVPTLPITCAIASPCTLRVMISVGAAENNAASHNTGQQCSGASQTDVLVQSTECGVLLTGFKENNTWIPETATFDITTTVDGKLAVSDRTTRVIRMHTESTGSVASEWKGVILPDIHMTIIDAEHKLPQGQCFSNDDPYMRTFDFKTYHMHLQGSFVLYKNLRHAVEVHAFYQPCRFRSGATCNCAVAVRSGTDVFLYDSCTKTRTATGVKGTFVRSGLVGCGAVGMLVTSTSSTIEIKTSTQSRVTISYNRDGPYSINIVPSPLDFNQTEGLCGVYNGNSIDDFKHSNGMTKVNYDDQFALSWRLPVRDSLFAKLLEFGSGSSVNGSAVSVAEELTHCSCDDGLSNGTVTSVVCTKKATATINCQPNLPVNIMQRHCSKSDNSSSGNVLFEDFDYEYDGSDKSKPLPGWTNGWSEQSARSHCSAYIHNATMNSGCRTTPGVDLGIGIQQCIEGIRLTGSTGLDFTALEQVRRDCIANVERNSTQARNASAEQEVGICPRECNNNGKCLRGKCICNQYFVDEDCSIDIRIPPSVELANAACDRSKATCVRFPLYGSGVAARADTLTCRFEILNNGSTGSVSSSISVSRGIFLSFWEMACDLPTHLRSAMLPAIVLVSPSNDATNFGKGTQIIIYDGTCQLCNTSSLSCVVKENMCYIDGVCYRDGAKNAINALSICWSRAHQAKWTNNLEAINLIETPAVTWELIESLPISFRFLCGLPSRPLENNLLLNITWLSAHKTANGGRATIILGTVNAVRYEDLPATLGLDQLPSDFRFNAEISCTVTPWMADGRTGIIKSSKPFFAGVEVWPKEINILEGERQNIRLTTTVPIICRANSSFSTGCSVDIDVSVSPSCTQAASNPPSNNLLVDGSSCGASIAGWQADGTQNGSFTTTVAVVATADGRFGWSRDTVSKKIRIRTVSGSMVALAWDGLELPEINVKIIDRDRTSPAGMCYSNNDPHMQTFDKRPYEMHQQGAFVLYRNTIMDTEVQSFYQPCSPSSTVTCNCAIAVRSGRDVFVIDACDKIRVSTGTRGRFFRAGVVGCTNRGLSVLASGKVAYEVLLPTGASVRLSFNQNGPYSVTVIPGSMFDMNSTKGLCGVFNGSPKDDFQLQSGSTLTDYTIEFANDWRVPVNDSLFVQLPAFGVSKSSSVGHTEESSSKESAMYCSCEMSRNTASSSLGSLVQTACVKVPGIAGRDCPAQSQNEAACNVKDSARGDDLLFEPFVYIYDDGKKNDQVSNWNNGWTEQKATTHCRDYLLSNNNLKSCLSISSASLDKAVKQCALDIKLTGTTEYQFVAAELIAAECKAEVERNVSMWNPSPKSGDLEIPAWVVDVTCPVNCSNRGICEKGLCKCREPFYGRDCSADGNTPPVLTESSGHCDQSTNRTSCNGGVRLYGNDFSELGVICRFELDEVLPNSHGLAFTSELSKGITRSFGQVDCHVPVVMKAALTEKRLPLRYNVSVSNDGKMFSNKLGIWIYDSNCHSCFDTRTMCATRANVCIIDGICYSANTTRPGSYQICVPTASKSEWTTPEELKIPKITVPPLAEWRLTQSSTRLPQVVFECSHNHTREKHLVFDVVWKSEEAGNGNTTYKTLIVERNVSQDNFPVLLRPNDMGEDFKFGVKIYCEMTPYYTTSQLVGSPVKSNTLFAGVEVTPTAITITEGQTAKVTLKPTIPITCAQTFFAGACPLHIVMTVGSLSTIGAASHGSSQHCNGAPQADVLVQGVECGLRLSGASENVTWIADAASFEISSTVDGKRAASDYTTRIIRMRTAPTGAVASAWRGISLPNIHVTILDGERTLPKGQCFSNDDPYMRTFDYKTYHMHIEGPFVLYKNRQHAVEVQAFYQPCRFRAGVTCNCAVAVRSGREVFLYDSCTKTHVTSGQRGTLVRSGIVGCGAASMLVTPTASTIEITTSTLTKVTISYNKDGPYSVNILPSPLDFGQTEGLCGLYNGISSDDFIHRNGRVTVNYDIQFALSWRLSLRDSLFSRLREFGENSENEKSAIPTADELTHCSCDEGILNSTIAAVVCTKKTTAKKDCLPNFNLAGSALPRHCLFSNKSVSDDVFFDDFDYGYNGSENPNPVPGWSNGWSEQSARSHCTAYIHNATENSGCRWRSGVSLGTGIEQCIEGIRLSGSTSLDFTALEQVRRDCISDIERNSTQTNETSTAQEVNLCPLDCNRNGRCVKGECVCYSNFVESDCSIDLRVAPSLELAAAPCDRSSSQCIRIPVYGSGISSQANNLSCHLKLLNDDSSRSILNAAWVTNGSFVSYWEAMCEIPNDLRSTTFPAKILINVSNDGVNFGKGAIAVIFSSSCHVCNTSTSPCTIKERMCFIDGACYSDGAVSAHNASLICLSQSNPTSWTTALSLTTTDGNIWSTSRPSITCGECHVAETRYAPVPRSDCRMFFATRSNSSFRIVCPPKTRFELKECGCASDERAACFC